MLEPPQQPEGAAEIVHHQVHPLDAQCRASLLQELRVATHVVFEVARRARLAEAGHVERHRASQLAGCVYELRPIAA